MPDSENMRTVIVGGKSLGNGFVGGSESSFQQLLQTSARLEMNLRYLNTLFVVAFNRSLVKLVLMMIGARD